MDRGPQRRLLFTNARIFYPGGDWDVGWLMTEGSKIKLMARGYPPEFEPDLVSEVIDASGLNLLPGFIDVHAHGAVGVDTMDADVEGLRSVARFYAEHGVTAYLPTTWTAPRQPITRALHTIAQVRGRVEGGATILGAHLEGPYLNVANAGAQDARYIRMPEREEALEFLDAGVIRRITLAPENDEGLWLTQECSRRGIAVSAGHTSASYEQIAEAAQRGLGSVTHCFNAMGYLNHRQPGTVGAALSLPEITCELIGDGVHVNPVVMKILVQAKGPNGVMLITDALRWAGGKEGTFITDKFDNRQMIVKDGAVRLTNGTLVGSTLTMERALHNIITATGRSIGELWPLSSLNAARVLGVSSAKGSLEVGKDADLALLDADFDVRLTVAEGEIVYRADTVSR